MWNFTDKPGLLFVVATLLPLLSFLLIFLHSGLWALARSYRDSQLGDLLFYLRGREKPAITPAYIALASIAASFACCAVGAVLYFADVSDVARETDRKARLIHELESAWNDGEHREALLARHNAIVADEQKADLKEFAATLKTQLEETVDKVLVYNTDIKSESLEKATLVEKIEKTLTREQLKDALEETEASLIKNAEMQVVERKWKDDLFTLFRLSPSAYLKDPEKGSSSSIGYKIDSLAVLMFLMVTFIATLIHLYSIGYMSDETQESVEDHQVHGEFGHLQRRGRFGRFFMYLSLFSFSMLNLLLANNLLQVFVSWELVGICSFLLIGFYYERQTASNAANKAFIANRVGDAGFILGLLILWGYLGTFEFDAMFNAVRAPRVDSHNHVVGVAGQMLRGELEEGDRGGNVFRFNAQGSELLLFARRQHTDHDGMILKDKEGKPQRLTSHEKDVQIPNNPGATQPTTMPYWMLVVAGLGIFLGCVGKSAQFPLQVWLPDAMEGPTPVSALIHAATMVAAGVYLVGRCYPLFTPEVLLFIAYTGAITLFMAATVAVVVNDIKQVLAFSTVSQLGLMMLAMGVGGWLAGLFHLLTHAFFKALLFLGAGSVIHGYQHQQDMREMGGLYDKMKITAVTMLIAVLAISGLPLLSGWYSKDAVFAHALGYVVVHPQHALLFLLPLLSAGITTFYMFRLWFMTFTGPTRNPTLHQQSHESPWIMTVPLIVLAFLSITAAWGWPIWDAKASLLEHGLKTAMPSSVLADFGSIHDKETPVHSEHWVTPESQAKLMPRHWVHELHTQAGLLALLMSALGLSFALASYYYRVLDPSEAKEQFPWLHELLVNRWYFDHAYSTFLVKPAIILSHALRSFDLRVLDGLIHTTAHSAVRIAKWGGTFDQRVVDWLVNLLGTVTYSLGSSLRSWQSGFVRNYLIALALAAIGLFVLLSYLASIAKMG
jgi:NADH-quinone oxidoreductase subunit L